MLLGLIEVIYGILKIYCNDVILLLLPSRGTCSSLHKTKEVARFQKMNLMYDLLWFVCLVYSVQTECLTDLPSFMNYSKELIIKTSSRCFPTS